MRHIVAVLVVLMLVVSASRSPEVHGQTSCTFVGGFASVNCAAGGLFLAHRPKNLGPDQAVPVMAFTTADRDR